MGRVVVTQPNGLYALFCTVTINFTHVAHSRLEARWLLKVAGLTLADAEAAIDRAACDEALQEGWPLFRSDGLDRWRYCLDVVRASSKQEAAALEIACGDALSQLTATRWTR